jgi:hypothetical protein
MGSPNGSCLGTWPKIADATFFLATAASMTASLLKHPAFLVDSPITPDAAFVGGALLFLTCSSLVFVRPGLACGLGLLAGLVIVAWFVWSERAFYESSWISLNLVDPSPEEAAFLAFVKLRVMSVPLVVTATACSVLRLLPARWIIGKSPLSGRTWPAVAAGLLVTAVWFAHSVSPYRVPVIADGPAEDLRILHIEKRGLHLYETRVSAMRNGRAFVSKIQRRLFQYRFGAQGTEVWLSGTPEILEEARAVMASPEIWNLHTPRARTLDSWNAEGWYVTVRDSHLVAFTSEYKTAPPADVTKLFHEIERLPGKPWPYQVQDVCLGFCYDPVAALGFWYSNQSGFALMRRNN